MYSEPASGDAFDIEGATARTFITMPANPSGKRNAEVIHRRFTGTDLARRFGGRWAIDVGHGISEADAALFEGPDNAAMPQGFGCRIIGADSRRATS